jgi:ribosomal protein S18 acetylase RimI-like enzyme
MASITLPARAVVRFSGLRPLNILHDLPQVADLIELCFESSLDDEGQSYLQQMRRASGDQAFLSWAGRVMDSTSMPLSGFVWEEGGKIIGNASLVYQSQRGRKIAMIANVATHPNYRRRGIGRALTEQAMAGAWQKGAWELWLHVRDDNSTAIKIYSDLGFVQRGRRSTYRSTAGLMPSGTVALETKAARISSGGDGPLDRKAAPVTLQRPSARHWPLQHAWLERAHPDGLSWYSRWDWKTLGPGWRNSLRRMLIQFEGRQWAAVRDSALLATVSWIPTLRVSSALWLASPPDGDEAGVRAVLDRARRELAHYRNLTVEYPAGEMVPAIQSAGFEMFRTLMWMQAPATPQVNSRMNIQKEIKS